MQATTTLNLRPALTARVAVPLAHEPAEANVIAALVEALTSSEHYELIERNGELFVQPVANARPAQGVASVFSPDARARRGSFELAA